MTVKYERNVELLWTEDPAPSVKHPKTVSVSLHGNSGDLYVHIKDRDGDMRSLLLEEDEWGALSALLQEVGK